MLEVSAYWKKHVSIRNAWDIKKSFISVGEFVLRMGITNIVEHWLMVNELWSYINKSRSRKNFACVELGGANNNRDEKVYALLIRKDWEPEGIKMQRVYIKEEDYVKVAKELREYGFRPECELFRLREEGIFILGWRLREELCSADSELARKLRKYVYVKEIDFSVRKNAIHPHLNPPPQAGEGEGQKGDFKRNGGVR